MPVTYTGPRDLKGLATGERIDMNFGHPIDISDIKKMNDEGVAEVARRIQEEFDRLDAEAQAINTCYRTLTWRVFSFSSTSVKCIHHTGSLSVF